MKKKRTCEWQKKKNENVSASGVKSQLPDLTKNSQENGSSKNFTFEDDDMKRRRKPFENIYNPNRHTRRREMTEIVDTSICGGCGEDFKTISLLERHIPMCSHKGRICELESLKSVYGAENSADSESDDDYDPNKHLCIYCVKQFTYLGSLRNHIFDICPVRKELVEKNEYIDEDWEQDIVEKTGGKREQISRRGSTDSFENANIEDETSKDAIESSLKTSDKRQRRRRRGNGWGTPKAIKSNAFNKTIKQVVSADGFIYEYYVESELPIISFDLSDTFILDVDKNKDEGNAKKSSKKSTKSAKNNIFTSDSKPVIDTGPPRVPRQEMPLQESDLQAEDLRKCPKKTETKNANKGRKTKIDAIPSKKKTPKAKAVKQPVAKTKRNIVQSKVITDYLKKKKKVISTPSPKASTSKKLVGKTKSPNVTIKEKQSTLLTGKSSPGKVRKTQTKTISETFKAKAITAKASSKKKATTPTAKAVLAKCVKKKLAQKKHHSKINKSIEKIEKHAKRGSRKILSSRVKGHLTKKGFDKTTKKHKEQTHMKSDSIVQGASKNDLGESLDIDRETVGTTASKATGRKRVNILVSKAVTNKRKIELNGMKRRYTRKKGKVANGKESTDNKEVQESENGSKSEPKLTKKGVEQPVKIKRKYTKKTIASASVEIPRVPTERELRIQEKFKKVKSLLKQAGNLNKIVPLRESKAIEKASALSETPVDTDRVEDKKTANGSLILDTEGCESSSKLLGELSELQEKEENKLEMPVLTPVEKGGCSDKSPKPLVKRQPKSSDKGSVLKSKLSKNVYQQSKRTSKSKLKLKNNKIVKRKVFKKKNKDNCDTIGAVLDAIIRHKESIDPPSLSSKTLNCVDDLQVDSNKSIVGLSMTTIKTKSSSKEEANGEELEIRNSVEKDSNMFDTSTVAKFNISTENDVSCANKEKGKKPKRVVSDEGKPKMKKKRKITKEIVESPINHNGHDIVMDTVADDEMHLLAQMSPSKSPQGWGLKSSLATMMDAWNEAALECSLETGKLKKRSRKNSGKHSGKNSPSHSNVETNGCLIDSPGEKSQDEGYVSVDKSENVREENSTLPSSASHNSGKNEITSEPVKMNKPRKRKTQGNAEIYEQDNSVSTGSPRPKKRINSSMDNIQNEFINDGKRFSSELLSTFDSVLRKDCNGQKKGKVSPSKAIQAIQFNGGYPNEVPSHSLKNENSKSLINSKTSSPSGKSEKTAKSSGNRTQTLKSASNSRKASPCRKSESPSKTDKIDKSTAGSLDVSLLNHKLTTIAASQNEETRPPGRRKSKNIFDAMDAMQRCETRSTNSRSSSPNLKKPVSRNSSKSPLRAFKITSKDSENSNSSNNSSFAADSIDLVTNTFCTAVMKSPKKSPKKALQLSSEKQAEISSFMKTASSKTHCVEAVLNDTVNNSPKKHSVISSPNVFSFIDTLHDALSNKSDSKDVISEHLVRQKCSSNNVSSNDIVYEKAEENEKNSKKLSARRRVRSGDNSNLFMDSDEDDHFSDDTETYSEFGDNDNEPVDLNYFDNPVA